MNSKPRKRSKEKKGGKKVKDKVKKKKNKEPVSDDGGPVVLTQEEKERLLELKRRINSDLDDDEWDAARYADQDIKEYWTEVDTVKRIQYDEVDVETFMAKFDAGSRPCLIEGAMDDWKASRRWNRRKFAKRFGHKTFDVGSYNHTVMALSDYLRYCDANEDDSPLYIFEPQYADKFPKLTKEFTIPKYFVPEQGGQDLQGMLDDDPRPYYRWLLMGPERSGTGIHQDPGATVAWNALLEGHKRWVMFPPHIKASVVKPKKGEPDSAIYWFTNIYPKLAPKAKKLGMLECVQGPGEMIYVPADWWHLVLNVSEFTISVTQNHVTEANFEAAFNSLKRGKPKKALAWYDVLPSDYQTRVIPPSAADLSKSSSSYSYESDADNSSDDDDGSSSSSSS